MPQDPATLPDDLQHMLVKPLGRSGVVGVLADWIDERNALWPAFTEALRLSTPMKHVETDNCGPFRHRIVARGVTFAVAEHFGPTGQPPRIGVVVNVFRFTPGRVQAWPRLIPSAALPEGLYDRLCEEIAVPKRPPTRKKKSK